MRFLFIIGIDMNENGPSVHLLNDIMEEVRKKGHKIVRIQKKYGRDTWELLKEESVDTIYTCETAEPHSISYYRRYLNDIKYAIKCYRVFKKSSFDAVFLQSCNNAGYQVRWIKKYLKCPILFNVQDIFPLDLIPDGTMSNRSIIYKFFSLTQNYAYHNSKSIITISEDMKESLMKLGVDAKKLSVIYNWAYKAPYNEQYENMVREKYYSNDYYYVVYAGNIGTAQNVELLINASIRLESNPKIKILIIGSGSRLKKCKELADENHLQNVLFYDLAPQQLAQYIYSNADVNIVTLTKGIYKTSFPSKTAACCCSGKPVIYCVEDEAKTIQKLKSANSLIFQCNPDSSELLANTILQLYNNKNSAKLSAKYEEVLFPQGPIYYADELEKCAL